MHAKSFILFCLFTWPGALIAQTATFENVKEQSIKIQDVPKASESVVPKMLSKTATLPKVPKLESLKKGRDVVARNVVLVHARQKPVSRLQRHGTLASGHGVWVQTTSGTKLISAGHWLEGATEIFLDPNPKKQDPLKTETRTLSRQTYGTDRTKRLLKDGKLLRLKVETFDKNRNVATLVPFEEQAKLESPDGLVLFPIEDEVAARTYGFSPLLGSVLVQTLFQGNDKNLAISFYLQTDFRGLLGAPIVDADGRLIAITAFSHPESDRTLVVPPVALRVFLEKVTGTP